MEMMNVKKKGGAKTERYRELMPQVRALVAGESDLIANMGNVAAALKEVFGFWWVGFYLVRGRELVLGPFQGPVACTRIGYGKGVCGTAWATGEAQVVPDVEVFPGHIACSAQSKSEIVLPLKRGGAVVGVLDIDSEHLGTFDQIDRRFLEEIVALLDF